MGLPTEWLGGGGGGGQHHTGYAALMGKQSVEDDIIPTAIVVKNIPFHVPKEALLGIMVSFSPALFSFRLLISLGGV